MSEDAMRILVVDDHDIVRRGLSLMLGTVPGVKSVVEAADCASALGELSTHSPNLVVMDAHLPGTDGIQATRMILELRPKVKIVMLSGDSDPELILEALRAGVLGYVVKENTLEEVLRAIRAVIAGKGYFSPEVAGVIARYCRTNRLGAKPAPEKHSLSETETRLLQLIAQGKRSKEMSVILNVSTKTVETYRSRLMTKLGCASPVDLARFAIREGIASL